MMSGKKRVINSFKLDIKVIFKMFTALDTNLATDQQKEGALAVLNPSHMS